ncbi:pilus assembly protein, partial [Salmonella enterica subsp. enterica serovar Give]
MLSWRVFRPLLVLTLCGVPLWAQAFCFDAAAAKYHVS